MSEKMYKETIIKTMNNYWRLLKKAENMVDFHVVRVGLLNDDTDLVSIEGYEDEYSININEYDLVPIEWFSMGKRELKRAQKELKEAKKLTTRRNCQREKEEKEQTKKEKLSNKNK